MSMAYLRRKLAIIVHMGYIYIETESLSFPKFGRDKFHLNEMYSYMLQINQICE